MKKLLAVWIVAFLFSCVGRRHIHTQPQPNLRFVGEYLLPDSTIYGGTRVGGLSGIDYNPADSIYYLISDDRSDKNPARFYKAKIVLGESGIRYVRFTGVTTLLQQNGQPYPRYNDDTLHSPDPEALRLNRQTGNLVWSSEGERVVANGYALLQQPFINIIHKNGHWVDSFHLPANLHITATEKGPRRNGVLESLCFSPDGKWLYAALEEPLYEDGPKAGTGDSAAWVRILKFDVQTRNCVLQHAYRIDPVVRNPKTAGGFKVNGVVDLLTLSETQLIVTERSYSSGYADCNIRVYLADIGHADDVLSVRSLAATPPKRSLQKRLLFNMDSLGRTIYNIEGATFGPQLPNGKQSLLFVADDNFSGSEKTQFLLFEM